MGIYSIIKIINTFCQYNYELLYPDSIKFTYLDKTNQKKKSK